MKKILFKLALFSGIIGIASAFYIYQFVINKSHPDYERIPPAYIMLASDLFESYRNDRANSEENYNGQIIQVNGTFDHIEKNDSLFVGVFIFDQGMFGEEGVRCTMLSSQNNNSLILAKSQEVRVKGFVTGYNDTDVILENCSFVN